MQLRITAFVSFHVVWNASVTFSVSSYSLWKLYGAELVTAYCRYFLPRPVYIYITLKFKVKNAWHFNHFTFIILQRYSQQFGSVRNKMWSYMLHVYIIYDLGLVVFDTHYSKTNKPTSVLPKNPSSDSKSMYCRQIARKNCPSVTDRQCDTLPVYQQLAGDWMMGVESK